MLAQLESEGYANVTDAFVKRLQRHKWNVPLLNTLTHLRRLFNSTTAESVSNHNEAELQRRCRERQQEIDHMQQVLETKIQLLQEVRPISTSGCWSWRDVKKKNPDCFHVFCAQEAQLARSEAERMASLAGSQSHPSLLSFNTVMEDIPDEEKHPRSLSPASSNKDRWGILNQLSNKLREIQLFHWQTVCAQVNRGAKQEASG